MRHPSYKLALAFFALLSTTSLMAADIPPRPISVTDTPATNAMELSTQRNAEMTFKQAAQKADAAMKKTRTEGGEWHEAANLLMQSSVTSRSGDFQTAIKMANQAAIMAEEAYKAVIIAKKAEAARKAAATQKAAEEKAAAARKAAAAKNSSKPTK